MIKNWEKKTREERERERNKVPKEEQKRDRKKKCMINLFLKITHSWIQNLVHLTTFPFSFILISFSFIFIFLFPHFFSFIFSLLSLSHFLSFSYFEIHTPGLSLFLSSLFLLSFFLSLVSHFIIFQQFLIGLLNYFNDRGMWKIMRCRKDEDGRRKGWKRENKEREGGEKFC